MKMAQFTTRGGPPILMQGANSKEGNGHMDSGMILKGRVLSFARSPFDGTPTEAARLDEAVLLQGGRIGDVGEYAALKSAHPQAGLVEYGDKVILAGFVDAHAHFPQTAMIASWGKRLIDWLNLYTFPEEMKFGDAAYASEIAARYLDLTAANGTTTICSFCTIHPESVDAFFTEDRKSVV